MESSRDPSEHMLSAARAGDELIVKTILAICRHDIDINYRENGWTALIYACRFGHTSIVKILLNHGAQVEPCNKEDTSCLIEACLNGHEDIVEILLNHGANIEVHGLSLWTPLINAASAGHIPIVRLLLDRDANTRAKTTGKSNALMVAAHQGHVEICSMLLKHCHEEMDIISNSGVSALASACWKEREEVVQLLLERGALIDRCTFFAIKMTNNPQVHQNIRTELLMRGSELCFE